jgi:hypothetical protein
MTPYVDPQGYENDAVNTALTKEPRPHLTGMVLAGDIRINGLTLNTIDANNVVWVCTDIEGWWNASGVEVQDYKRGLDDGSYDVRGRWTARSLTLTGAILTQSPSQVPAAREALLEAFNLVYTGAWLFVDESPKKAAYVRLAGQPTVTNTSARGRIDFSIPLKAGDPIKYDWNDSDAASGLTSVGLTNLISNPNFETNADGWGGYISTTVARSTSKFYSGTASLKVSSVVTGSPGALYVASTTTGTSPAVIAGEVYTASAYGLSETYNTTAYLNINWYDSSDTIISQVPDLSPTSAQIFSINPSTWTRLSLTTTAPAGAVKAQVAFYTRYAGTGAEATFYDAVLFHQAYSVYPYFDITNATLTNQGNTDVAASFVVTAPVTAPAYITSTKDSVTQTIKIIKSLRAATTFTTSNVSNSVNQSGIATLTITNPSGVSEHGFLVGDTITVTSVAARYNKPNVVITAITSNTLSYVNPGVNVVSITHSSNLATVTTAANHGMSAGNSFHISGTSNPIFNGTYAVVSNTSSTTFTFTKTVSNQPTSYEGKLSYEIASAVVSSGVVTLSVSDTLEIDTYNNSVEYRGLPDSSRSMLAADIDWIKLKPGNNVFQFTKTGGVGTAVVKYRSGWIG